MGLFSWAENRGLVIGGACVLAMAAWVVHSWSRSRITPEELESKRRRAIQQGGKLGDAEIFEVRDRTLHYSYSVRGVAYTASQDVSALVPLLPENLSGLLGPASVKYDPRNPANSIVMAENWSGLRIAQRGN